MSVMWLVVTRRAVRYGVTHQTRRLPYHVFTFYSYVTVSLEMNRNFCVDGENVNFHKATLAFAEELVL